MVRPALAAGVLLAAAPAAAAQVAYEGSLGATTGRYIFTGRTTTFSISTGVALTAGGLTVRAALPLLLQNSTVITSSGSGGTLPSGGSSAGTVGGHGRRGGGQSGGGSGGPVALRRVEVPASAFTDYRAAIGDPLVSASAQVLRRGSLGLGIGAAAKVPLADTAHFGTGEWDLGVNASASVRVGSSTLIGVDAAWWYLGDLPELDFDNPFSGSVSLTHVRAARWAVSGFLRASTPAVPGFAAPATAGGGLAWLSRRSAIGFEAAVGLTETSPDLSVSAYWRVQVL